MNKNLPVVSNKATLAKLLDRDEVKANLKTVAPKHLTPDRLIKMALVAASRQPKLFECTQESILKAVMTSAELGLDCSGSLGRAYLVPFYNNKIGAMEALFIPGYMGLLDLVRRSGELKQIDAQVVYKEDEFVCEFGLEPKLVHKPNWEASQNDNDIVFVYAIAHLTDGFKQYVVLTKAEINKVRAVSKAKDLGPWKSWYPEMCKKTALRRLCKFLPLETEKSDPLIRAIDADNEGYDLEVPVEITTETPPSDQRISFAPGKEPEKVDTDTGEVEEVKPEGQEDLLGDDESASLTRDQSSKVYAIGKANGWSYDDLKAYFGKDVEQLLQSEYNNALLMLRNNKPDKPKE